MTLSLSKRCRWLSALTLVVAGGCGLDQPTASTRGDGLTGQLPPRDLSCHVAIGSTCYQGVRLCPNCPCGAYWNQTGWAITPERCFAVPAVDDNCNGQVDEGCPTTVQLESVLATPMVGGAGGAAFSVYQPAVITTVHVQSRRTDTPDKYVSGLLTEYHALAPTPMPITVGDFLMLQAVGADPGTWTESVLFPFPHLQRWSDSLAMVCPAGQVVIGIDGRAGSYVDEISVRCATPHLISFDSTFAPGSFGVRFSGEATAPAVTTFPFQGFSPGGQAFSLRCPNYGVAVGWYGRQGSWIDALGLYCAQIVAR